MVPRGEDEVLTGQQERGSQVERIEASEIVLERETGGVLDEWLVDLDNTERGPFIPDRLYRADVRCTADGTNGLDVSGTTDEPSLGASHRVTDEFAALLSDVALDEGACIQIQVQRSASRSRSTSAEALTPLAASFGGRAGRTRVGDSNRPWATS